MQILQSTEYKKFKTLKGNRAINRSHVLKIGRSIAAHPDLIQYNPVMVNEKMEIIDGQHRFEALKELEMTVPYVEIVGGSAEAAQILNANQANWKPLDYAKSFAANGNEHYATYVEVKEANPDLRHGTMLALLEGGTGQGGTSTKKFRDGEFAVHNNSWQNELEQLEDVREVVGKGIWNRRDFTQSVVVFMRHPGYNHEQMLEKVEKYGQKYLKGLSGVAEHLQALERTYNEYTHQPEDQIHFLFDVYNRAVPSV